MTTAKKQTTPDLSYDSKKEEELEMKIRMTWNCQLRKYIDEQSGSVKEMNEAQMKEQMLKETQEELECFKTIEDFYWHYA